VKRALACLVLLAACNGGGLPITDPGAHPDLGRMPCLSECELTSCSEITDETTCNARPDCYSFMSGDLPCNSSGCSDHFERCADGPPACGTGDTACHDSCTTLTPQCRNGEVEIFAAPDQTCCPVGCTTSQSCQTGG
jgi:hypothetical protein